MNKDIAKVDINQLPAHVLIYFGHGKLKEEINNLNIGDLLELYEDVHELTELVDRVTLEKVRIQLGITNDKDKQK